MWKYLLFGLVGCRQVFGLDNPTTLFDAFVEHDRPDIAVDTRPPDGPGSLDVGLVFRYPLDALDASQIDETVNGRDLSCHACPAAIQSPRNGALEFSMNEIAQSSIGMTATLAPPFTVALWIEIEHEPTGGMIGVALNSQSYSIDYNQQKLEFALGNGLNAQDIGQYTVGTWQHVAFTDDGSMIQVFLDGTSTTQLATSSASATFTSLSLGESMDTKGVVALDELRGYSRVLTTQEIHLLAGVP